MGLSRGLPLRSIRIAAVSRLLPILCRTLCRLLCGGGTFKRFKRRHVGIAFPVIGGRCCGLDGGAESGGGSLLPSRTRLICRALLRGGLRFFR